MRRHLASTLLMLTSPLLIVGPLAQQPASGRTTPSTQGATGTQAAATASSTTVIGCIERADQVMTRGNTADVDSLDFMLIKVQPGGDADKPTGTSGATAVPGKPPATGVGTMYRLRGQTNEINPHVGHQVEISGTVTAPPSNAAGSGARANDADRPSATAPVTAGSAEQAPILTVTRMRLVSENCPRSER